MRATRLFALTLAGGLAATGIAACRKEAPGADGTAPIAVTASDTACAVAKTEAPAGVTVFKVSNTGTKVTEFYVYAAGDRVMGEVENIGPGLSRDLRVELTAGQYETACKPGMSGPASAESSRSPARPWRSTRTRSSPRRPRATSGTCGARPTPCSSRPRSSWMP